jgi:hypothetical protein
MGKKKNESGAKKRRRFLTRKEQADRYGKDVRTIKRWGKDAEMNMPPEYNFRGAPHREEGELEEWERSRVAASE